MAYEQMLADMQSFTNGRAKSSKDTQSPDEIWLVQHPPVYTQGVRSHERPRTRRDIPVVKSDRGGLISYHGPGQIVLYPLLDLQRWSLNVKSLVTLLEQSVVDLLAEYGIRGVGKAGAPGVYVAQKKIAALGLRIRRGFSYHGLSLNVDMDLSPFSDIDPCGFEDLEVTQLRDFGVSDPVDAAREKLLRIFLNRLQLGAQSV